MAITIRKSGFALVPEGKQLVHVDEVNLVPSGRPQMVEFKYSHANGGTIKEILKFDHPVAVDILGKRCDIAMGGTAEEGTEVEPEDLKDLFLGKTFEAEIKHTEGKKGGIFANIKYLTKLVSTDVEETDDEDDDDL
jgi:hypothetical protein